jgi:hypothetical protein
MPSGRQAMSDGWGEGDHYVTAAGSANTPLCLIAGAGGRRRGGDSRGGRYRCRLPEPYSPGRLGFAFEMPFLIVSLVAVGLALRSSRRRIAMTTAVIALFFALYPAGMLAGHAFWGGDWEGYSAAERILDLLLYAPPAAVYLAALLVELAAFTRRPLPRCHTVLPHEPALL